MKKHLSMAVSAAALAGLLTGCGSLSADPASSMGRSLTSLVQDAERISDTGLNGMADGFEFYCSNSPNVARDALRSQVNARLAERNSKYRAANFCEEVQ